MGEADSLTVTIQCNGCHDGGQTEGWWSIISGNQLARLEGMRVGIQEGFLEDETTQGNPEGIKGATQLQGREGFHVEGTAYAKTRRMEEE